MQILVNIIMAFKYFFVFLFCQGALGSQEIIWRSLEELLSGGWYAPYPEGPYGPGVSFSKPSNLSRNLAPLDAGMSGDKVWSGLPRGNEFQFRIDLAREEFCGASEANVTIRYYYNATKDSTGWNGIHFFPCANTPEVILTGDPVYPVEWREGGCPINISWALSPHFRIFTDNTFLVVLDEIRISHNGACATEPPPTTENPDFCDESCEYKAIDCHNYYSCVNSQKEYFTCDEEDGLAFNPELGICDWMENVEGCKRNCGCEYRPHLGNCSLFYFCQDKCQEESCEVRSCSEGLLWSVEENGNGGKVQQCRVIEKANCFGV